MNKLKKYVYKQLNIWGVDTYLIYLEHYKEVVELLNLHSSSLAFLDIVERVKSVELYLAVVHIPKLAEQWQWMPMLCYKNGEQYYHVQYHSSWMCRECRADNGTVIMPMFESDKFYYGFPLLPVPEEFHKVNCKKCGKHYRII